MDRILFCFLLAGIISSVAKAQSVKGTLRDVSDNTPVSGATIKLIPSDSTSAAFTSISNNTGIFSFDQISSGDYTVTITSVGYETIAKAITVGTDHTDMGTIAVSKSAKTLKTVVVSGAAPPVKQKQDTVEYSANQFK